MLIFLIFVLFTVGGCTRSLCTRIDVVPASIDVRVEPGRQGVVGLAGDKDTLNFGDISPQMKSQKSVNVGYTTDADVVVAMEGNFSAWTTITPSKFHLSGGEAVKVDFDVTVPGYTPEGNYTGQAVFCFKEK